MTIVFNIANMNIEILQPDDIEELSSLEYIVAELTSKGTQCICLEKLHFPNTHCLQYTDCSGFEGFDYQYKQSIKYKIFWGLSY